MLHIKFNNTKPPTPDPTDAASPSAIPASRGPTDTPRANPENAWAQPPALTMSHCHPIKPADVLRLAPPQSGYYVFGFPDFQVRQLRIANIFHRSFAGPHEDFVLGVLSVLLIAVLTEIFQVVLMRSSNRRVTNAGFHAAYVLDEVTHFRNVVAHLRHRSRSRASKSLMWSSLTILSIGAVLIAAEVFAVYLTQPFKVYSSSERYNLRGIQPVETTDDVSTEVDKLTEKKRCVSPMMPNSNHTREYAIVACVNRFTDTVMKELASKATFVEIASWFHKAGSDHYITYGNAHTEEQGRHELWIRASIMQSDMGVSNGILFEMNDSTLVSHAEYLHRRAIQVAIDHNCKELNPSENCDRILADCQIESTDARKKTITLWEVKEETGVEVPVEEEVDGIVTRFKIELAAPGRSLTKSLRIFATSAAIQEVLNGEGKYVSMPNGQERSSLEGLISEEGRIAGVVLLGLILLIMLALLVLLRMIFKPTSLASLARDAFDAEEEDYGEGFDFRDTYEHTYSIPQSVWGLERDIVDPEPNDYDSTDTFDVPRDPPPKRGFWRPHDRGPRSPV